MRTDAPDGTAALTAAYEPETPFADFEAIAAEPLGAVVTEGPLETPFVSAYLAEGSLENPAAVDFKELLFELYDTEFDEAVAELTDEATFAHRDLFLGEAGPETLTSGVRAEQFLEEYFEPLRLAAETMLERMGDVAAEQDLASLSETQIDEAFAPFAPAGTGLSEAFEDFLGGLWNKAKKVAKGAINLAKKGVAAVAKILPIGVILKRLKALVRPLLERVLKLALDRLPAPLRPHAERLARRFLGQTPVGGIPGLELEADVSSPEAEHVIGHDGTQIQHEFDAMLAGLMFAGDEVQQEVVLAEVMSESWGDGQAEAVDGLDAARQRFAAELESLEPGRGPQELLERFLPAILPALRIGIQLIGRPKVVNFLAGLLGKLIQPYVGPQITPVLSRAIVDSGLRLMTLEAPAEAQQHLAGAALAATVEDTVRGVAERGPETFEDDRLLEAAAYESFLEAAAANFPPALIRPEYREAAKASGTWVSLPKAGRPYYRKYTQVFDVTVTPQVAKQLTTFGGIPLQDALRDRLSVTLPAKARVHLYQVTQRTTAGRIARLERLGGRGTWRLFHPLTPEAAGILLGEPGLGRRADPKHLSTPLRLAVGQRIYFLAIDGARPRVATAPPGRAAGPARPSEANVTIDFPKTEIRAWLFLSERQAQEIAAKIRAREPHAAIIAALQSSYTTAVTTALSGGVERHVKILHESLRGDDFLGGALNAIGGRVREQVARQLVAWIGAGLAKELEVKARQLVEAANEPADGVTVAVSLAGVPGLADLRAAFAGRATAGGFSFGTPARTEVRILPGYHRD